MLARGITVASPVIPAGIRHSRGGGNGIQHHGWYLNSRVGWGELANPNIDSDGPMFPNPVLGFAPLTPTYATAVRHCGSLIRRRG
uniref:Uncharacterized protein n=1 Tax=Candidatus Kentrum sp. UNK TaxID=2126344 RepID=A0A451APV0_9GAMM|nr:MAG: hypothetical protein BECKUNK1418G_GA0071005_11884 [Candidatus Kentron sp. UNK]VFK71913.1 MAG: hypothetical protein BECKUNK1418H_GA0071006_10874 [Candidatus Kentron sp. UNK]